MRRALVLAVFLLLAFDRADAAAQTLNGAGSTFAYPVISRWAAAYHQATGRDVAYQPVGSTGGAISLRQGLVDFGVTDAPLVDAQLLRDGLTQFPLVMGAIVPVVGLPGVAPGALHLPATLLADIYLGRVRSWHDPAITAANPGLALPDAPIKVIYRSDGSGTSFNWTNYLSRFSAQWRGQAGAGTKVAWPVGSGVQGSSGMAAAVGRISGAIGYIEYSAAKAANLTYALPGNATGRFVPPEPRSYQATVAAMDWTKVPDFAFVLSDADAPDGYPLMATSFVLTRVSAATPDFFRWVIENGQSVASGLDYLPLPPSLVAAVEARWIADGPLPATGPVAQPTVQPPGSAAPATPAVQPASVAGR